MAHSLLAIQVESLEGNGERFWPRLGRLLRALADNDPRALARAYVGG